MSASADLVLSIDCGTQSVRALVFDAAGVLRARHKVEYEPYFSSQPGWAEQDPEVWWRSLVAACRSLVAESPDLVARIGAIAVTTQRDSMLCLGDDGMPLRPAILWLDSRKAPVLYHPDPLTRLGLAIIGMEEAVKKTQQSGACNWIRTYERDVWARTRSFVQVSGFINHRLTGELVDSVASQIGHMPFDYRSQSWASPRHLNTRMFPVERDKLPRLSPAGTVLGMLTARAASQTGLPAGLPVIAAGSDKGCETIGVGVVDGTSASLSFGTTATVQTTSRRYLEPLAFMPSYPAPIPGRFNPEVEIFRGYWMISWFKNQFAYQEVMEAQACGIPAEAMLDELLCSTEPGSHGLVMQPYWTAGLKQPSAKGAIIGFGDVHERSHLYRAIIEGLAFGLREGLEAIERVSRRRVSVLRVSGGASQSDAICQISADVLGLPLERGSTHESSGLGAAMCAAAGLGWYADVAEAAHAMSSTSRVFEPDASSAALYTALYRRVYRKMYRSLGPLYESIRDITGYPERP
ncbi:MAG TPA: FGGY-family carbohydrate kinase [bacterium]|nr:FGGY-family carbohydrate kinase [bacterium]